MSTEPAHPVVSVVPEIRRLVARFAAQRDVDDVTQDCCVRLLERERLYRPEKGSFAGWATTVARRVTFNAIRRRPREESLMEDPEDSERATWDADSADRVEWVLDQLRRLPEKQRRVLQMHYYEGLTTRAIGERLGISQPAAVKRIASAIATLKRRSGLMGLLSSFLPVSWAGALSGGHTMKFAAVSVAVLLGAATARSFFVPGPEVPLVARVAELPNTVFAPTLSAPLDPEQNALYADTLPMAWGELGRFLEGPPRLEGDPALARALNEAPWDPASLNPEHFVSGAGRPAEGVVERLQAELVRRFGQGRDPILDELVTGSPEQIIAYAFLAKNLPFAQRFQRLAEFSFQPSPTSKRIPARGFGIQTFELENPTHAAMSDQVIIHHYQGPDTFVVELIPVGGGDRILMARVAPGENLQETVRAALALTSRRKGQLQPGDTLQIPVLDFHLSHRWTELEGRQVLNPKANGMPIVAALQTLRLRLDESGAEVQGRAAISILKAVASPRRMIFDGPFLLAMLEKGQQTPYLAAWVANGDLLVAP